MCIGDGSHHLALRLNRHVVVGRPFRAAKNVVAIHAALFAKGQQIRAFGITPDHGQQNGLHPIGGKPDGNIQRHPARDARNTPRNIIAKGHCRICATNHVPQNRSDADNAILCHGCVSIPPKGLRLCPSGAVADGPCGQGENALKRACPKGQFTGEGGSHRGDIPIDPPVGARPLIPRSGANRKGNYYGAS